LCIAVGDSRQADALIALSGRKVWNRELNVVHLAGRGSDCQVLYVDSRQRWNAVEEQRALLCETCRIMSLMTSCVGVRNHERRDPERG
jgi:hypothetical protein